MGIKAAAMFMVLVFVVVINIPLNSATLCKYEQMKPSSSYDGYIESPGYPSPYPSELCIIWVFKGWPGLQVTIRFQDIDIPSYSGLCLNDLVRIGLLNEHTYCGDVHNLRNFDPYTAEFTSSNNWLYIVFNSTSVGTKGRGFNIYFQFTGMNNNDMPTTTMATTTSTVLYSKEEIKSDENLCNFIINDDSGYIMTNRTVLECLRTTGKASWQIFYPSVGNTNFKCKIFFYECNVPYPDKLTIYDGYLNEDSKLGEYSEGFCPNFLISSSSSLFLEYVRNDYTTLPSFNLMFMKIAADGIARNSTYETTKTHDYGSTEPPRYKYIPSENPANHYSSECIFHLTDQSGEINSANIASLVQKSGFCTWLLHFGSTDGQIVTYTLNLERFQVPAESTFVVYDGADMLAPVLGSYLEPFKSLISSQGSVFIYFNPGINVNLVEVAEFFTVGYQANFQCAGGYLPCGYGEHACYKNSDRCDNIWHCPLHGGDERGCNEVNCPQEFSCLFTTSTCYSESERCNGKAFCPNKMDEQNCEKAQCSPDKGLFLCRSGHCIFENMRCDQLPDCVDNSDEDNCSAYMSTRIIIAAVSGSLLCALMVVISMGCICKVYRMRNRHLQERQHYETPLTRHLAEMLRHRAPPPPYHEAMLTSRPYSEADLELLDHSEQQGTFGLLNPGYHDDMAPTSSTEPTQRSHHQDNGHGLQDEASTENEHQVSASRNGPGSLIEVGTLAFFSEGLENDDPYWGTAGDDLPPDDSELPPYSETDPSGTTGSYHSVLSDESCHDDSWQRSFASGIFAGGNSHSRSARELLIQMDIIPSDGAQHSASAHNVPHMARNADGMKSVPERHQMEMINGGNSDTETMSTSTRLSLDSSSDKDMNDTENDDVREDVDMLDADSDSECLLFEDNASDNNSESDTCILAHV